MKQFNLGTKVVVSDPCYDIPTWCQAVIENVLPGVYYPDVDIEDRPGWGRRIGEIRAVHEDYMGSKIASINWKKHPADIGVDSGQCGIFDFDHYRNDMESYDLPLAFGPNWASEPGDDWYQRMCSLTLEGIGWGVFPHGMNSSSGYGDGSYDLLVGTNIYGQVVGFQVIFIYDEDEEDDEEDYDDEDEDF